MNKSIETITRFLDAQGWIYHVVDDSSLRGVLVSDMGRWTWFIGVDVAAGIVQFQNSVPINVPAQRRPSAAEYLMRANWRICLASFQMDWGDGEVRCHTSLILDKRRAPSTGQLEHLLFSNWHAMDRYLPGLMAVIFGGATVEQALAHADNEPDSDAAASKSQADENGGTGAGKGQAKCLHGGAGIACTENHKIAAESATATLHL